MVFFAQVDPALRRPGRFDRKLYPPFLLGSQDKPASHKHKPGNLFTMSLPKPCMYISFYLSIYVSIYLSFYLSINQSIPETETLNPNS